MARYALRRLLGAIPTVIAASFLAFLIIHYVPGGPFTGLEEGRFIPPEVVTRLKAQYGLDRPLVEQYFRYLAGFVRGNLGVSLIDLRPVAESLSQGLTVSVQLGSLALGAAILAGLPLGLIGAVKRETMADHVTSLISVVGICVPSFVLGLLLIVVFALELDWLPVSGWGSSAHLLLPVAALAMEPLAVVARYTRVSMLDVLGEQYIVVARSKGAGPRRVLLVHALRNALIPTVTALGLVVPRLIVGSFLVESVFAIPGSGRYLVTAISRRDYPVLLGMVIVYVAIVVLANLTVELLYSVLDPRIRYD
jgi:oligopeptide transport system permease protein